MSARKAMTASFALLVAHLALAEVALQAAHSVEVDNLEVDAGVEHCAATWLMQMQASVRMGGLTEMELQASRAMPSYEDLVAATINATTTKKSKLLASWLPTVSLVAEPVSEMLMHGPRELVADARYYWARAGATDSLGASLATRTTNPASLPGKLLFVTLLGAFSFYGLMSLKDLHRFFMIRRLTTKKSYYAELALQRQAEEAAEREERPWSALALLALTSYRFHSGFLSATWLPYLLAMEGEDLWKEQQSLFMGVAKLIYGVTVLMNPVFGLMGDQAVRLSHGVGRRLFVSSGVCLAASGILLCIVGGRARSFSTFLVGLVAWRLGEVLNDVTSEALVPEMVPRSQYQLGSTIKALVFLLGGVFGYVLLLVFSAVHYTWLYLAYLLLMFACALPAFLLLADDSPSLKTGRFDGGAGWLESLSAAYLQPMQHAGNFPSVCRAIFVFSLGTGPMFFLLLIIRDVLGVGDPEQLQRLFSASSMVFLLSAALGACLSALSGDKAAAPGTEFSAQEEAFKRQSRVAKLRIAMLCFGLVCFAIPALKYAGSDRHKDILFFIMSSIFGCSFGAAFARFQDCTWTELPKNCDVANAMGFNVMSRLLGVGLGNFLAGATLDYFPVHTSAATGSMYSETGYIIVCSASGTACLLGMYLWPSGKA